MYLYFNIDVVYSYFDTYGSPYSSENNRKIFTYELSKATYVYLINRVFFFLFNG